MKPFHAIALLIVSCAMLTACAMTPDADTDGQESFQISKKKGQAYLDRGVPTMALPALRRARELQPNDPDVLLLLGMAYDQVDRPLQALESLERAYRLRPGDGRIANNLGVVLMRMERLDEARKAFENALNDVNLPTPEEIHFNLALLHKKQGQTRETMTRLEQAIQVKPGFVPALMELADLHRAMGRSDLEQKQLRLIVQEMPDHVGAMERLADSYLHDNKNKEARALLQAIRSLDPEGQAARRAMEKLTILEKLP
ncbi:MAG: tetratricopeptide repeat protein [Magnetococcus sp. YQC-5]